MLSANRIAGLPKHGVACFSETSSPGSTFFVNRNGTPNGKDVPLKRAITFFLCLSFAMVLFLSHPRAAMADCPTFMDEAQLGTVESSLLTEISGVAASRENADVLWVHNDSGDSARIYAMSIQGKHLGVYNLIGANATDWEDIAIGPGPVEGQDYIYAGDIGDNARQRSSVTVYRVAEPSVSTAQDPVTVDLDGVDALPMQYPGPAVYDCETLLVDPVSGDLFLVTKDRAGENMAHVFRNPAPHTSGVMVTLELVDSIPLTFQVTGGDVSPSGDGVLLRLYFQAYYWSRAMGTNLWEAFSGTACTVPLAVEPQGEAIAFAADGLGYYTVSEGNFQPIYSYEKDTSTILIPTGSSWKYLDDGSDQGTAWQQQTGFDDSGWASGPAQLGYGDGDEATVVSYGGDSGNKYITYYFRHSFDVEDASIFESLALRVVRDDGAVVYLNETEVFRTNMPGGAIDYETLAASTVGGSDESGFFATAVDPSILDDGPNVLAVEIHQRAVTSSDISFDLELRGSEEPASINLTKGPYLQSVTPNSIIAVWETDLPGDSVVEYGFTDAYGLEAMDAFSTTHHAVTIEGLSPYTTYHYRVLTNGSPLSEDSTFKTAADTTQGVFSFAVYGDDRTDHTAHQSVVNRALTLSPNFILNTGDLVQDGRVTEQWDTFFDIEQELLRTASFFPCPGNHERNNTNYFDLFHLPNNERYYSFDYGNAHIVALQVDGYEDYSVGSAQYNWFVNDLASTAQPWKFVFFHYPPYSSGSHGDNPSVQSALGPLFEQYGVQIVFNGHDHDYERSLVNGVNYIVAGGGGAPLYSVSGGPYTVYAESTLHVVSISVDQHTLTSVGVRPDGTTFDGFTITCTPLFGDLDCDCTVDIADVMQVASHWSSSVGDDDYDPAYDLDGDGDIDIVDIMLVAAHWGETC